MIETISDHKLNLPAGSTCPVCASEQTALAFRTEHGKFRTWVCDKCKFAFSVPRPSADELTELYSSGYFDGDRGQHGYDDYSGMGEDNMRRMWREFAVSLPLSSIRPKRILDVGCATGAFLVGAKELGWECVGVDMVEQALAIAASRGVQTFSGNILDVKLPPASFGVITMWHILEHLVDPLTVIKRTYELLAPGGYLFIEVPSWASAGRMLKREKWAPLKPPEHISFFSPASISYLARCAEFEVVRTSTHYPSILNVAALHPKDLRHIAARTLALAAMKLGLGGNLRLLAQKPV